MIYLLLSKYKILKEETHQKQSMKCKWIIHKKKLVILEIIKELNQIKMWYIY